MSVWSKLTWDHIEPENPGVTLFRVHGKLDGSQDCYAFLEAVRECMAEGLKHVVINLAEVERMNSIGIGILCACYTSITNAGGAMHLVGVPERGVNLMRAVGLWDQLLHYPTEGDVRFD